MWIFSRASNRESEYEDLRYDCDGLPDAAVAIRVAGVDEGLEAGGLWVANKLYKLIEINSNSV